MVLGKNLTVDVLVHNTVDRNGKRSSGLGGICSSSAGLFSITHLLKIFLILSSQESQAIGIKDSF